MKEYLGDSVGKGGAKGVKTSLSIVEFCPFLLLDQERT